MKTIKINIFISALFLLLFGFNGMAQNVEQTIRKAEESINKKVDEVYQLAQQKKIYEAMAKLKEVYDEIENERKWGTFDEKFIEAKMKNPSFSFNIKSDLPPQMSPEFWADFESKCDKILADQDVMIKGLMSEVNMNNWSKALAIGKQLKTIYETFTGIIENVGTANLPKLVYDLNGNVNDFFDNIIELENADVEELEIGAKKAKWNLTIAKAEKAKEKYNDFKHYIKTQKSLIDDFRVSVDYINKIKQKTSSGPLAPLTYADNKYNWNYGPFQKDVTEACKDFETYDIKCEELKKNFEGIKKEARTDWDKVEGNIIGSDDNEKKKEFLEYHAGRWTEFLGVVNPIFNKTYDKNCGAAKSQKTAGDNAPTKADQNQGNTSERTANDRILNIESLSIEPAYELIPGIQAKVRFNAKWDGQWLDRVQLRILIDNEMIVDEILAFRNNMGDFLSDFSKTILIPKHLSEGSHTLSIQMSRDPNILNKSIQLRCTPKMKTFVIGNTSTQTSDEDTKDAVPDYNDLFAGSKAQTKVEPEKKEPPKQTIIPVKQSGSVDKYWENEIPANADREWMKDIGDFHVRYQINGRTVGFRRYSDINFKYILNENVMDNFAVKHGSSRIFSFDKKTKEQWVSELSFYRADKKTGPYVRYFKGDIQSINYYIDDVKISEDEYRQKARSDKSLAPYDVYKDSKWQKFPTEKNMPDPPVFPNADNISYHELKIPAEAVKFVNAHLNSDRKTKFYTETYYLPNYFNEKVGERTWEISPSGTTLISEEVYIGRKAMFRTWSNTGQLRFLTFKNRDDYIDGINNNDRDGGTTVGLKFSEGKISYKKNDGSDCTLDEYEDERNEYPQLPPSSTIDFLKIQPAIAPNTHRDADNVNQDVTGVWIPNNSKIWRVYHSSNGSVSINYFLDHLIVGGHSWYDSKMTIPSGKAVRSQSLYLFWVHWFNDGELKDAQINGKIQSNGRSITYNDDRTIKWNSYLGGDLKNSDLRIQAYSGISNIPSIDAHLSPKLKQNMTPPNIPPAEMTPMFRSIWMKDEAINPNSNIVVPQQIETKDIPQVQENETQDNYQQLQREELYKLLEEINKKIDASDKSFNKPYWEGSNAGKVTMQATNPKQESLDILRSAISIIERAKYVENKGGLYHLIAMKLSNYSGRVFGYQAKQDFFTLAAELINKADQLITKNRYVKDDLSEAYCTSAEVWREMTRKALWGDHAYNKMACDKMVIQQYERAIQADPNNTKAKRILEQLKAPKKAIPAAVAKFEKIPDETWNNAQQEMIRMTEEKMKEEIYKEPETNYLEVANLTLGLGSGTVSILSSGAKDWEVVTDQHIDIYVNDQIKTSDDAKDVSVTFASDKTFLAIKSGSIVEFKDYNVLLIKRGNVWLQVQKKGSKFFVVGPSAATGIRGTTLEVQVNDDKTTETYLYEGVVEIRNANDIGYLVPGQKMIAKSGEEKLQQSDFNAVNRKESNWARIEEQQREHEHIKISVPVKSFGAKKTSTFSNTRVNNPLVHNTAPASMLMVDISASPDNQFHSLLSSVSIDYGDAALVARCPVNVRQNTPLTVNWYLNNQPQPISVGNYNVVPQATYFDATLISYDAPINPGTYRAEFVMNGQVLGKGSILIESPPKMNLQNAQQSYIEAVKLMESALLYVDQAEFGNAGQQARLALPDLQKALFNAPTLPDVLTVWQTAQSIIALDNVNQQSLKGNAENTLGWLAISASYINLAYNNCQDQQFKVTVQNLKALIDQL